MIGGWLAYCLVVSSLLAGAAAMLDAVLTARRRAARWVWAGAMLGMVALPLAAYRLQERPWPRVPGAGDARAGSIFDRVPPRTEPRLGAGEQSREAPRVESNRLWHAVTLPRRPVMPEVAGVERLAVAVIVLCIILATLRISFDSLLLYYSRRRWTRDVTGGDAVLLSDDFGPAVVGLIQPAMVLPRWTLTLPSEELSLMIAHEREHLRVGDGRLTAAALIVAACMPWNPVMWWALRRLRTAIEVDCDRRVLTQHPDVSQYGRLLVDVAQRAVGSSMAIAGFSERAAPLARRIQAMTARRTRRTPFSRFRDASALLAGLAAAAMALAVLPPEAPARTLATRATPAPVLAKNVGDSIATGDKQTLVAAATDLPAVFTATEYGPSSDGVPNAGRCATRLRDDRDGTVLQAHASHGSSLGVVQRGDTAWTRIGSVGFYAVRPRDRYGLRDGQLLRVGCGSFTHMTVASARIRPAALSTLESQDDDRARRIAAEVLAGTQVDPDGIELYANRLNVVMTLPASPAGDAPTRALVLRVQQAARASLGAAMPETLAVSLRLGRDQWSTFYRYTSMSGRQP